LRTDQITAPVTWTTDPATWAWQPLSTYTISALSRLDKSVDVFGRTQTWVNDSATGLAIGTTDAANISSSIARDAAGHITQETDRLGRITKYIRDAKGNALTTTRAFGTPVVSSESATYDSRGLRLSRTDALGNRTDFTYNTAGQLLTETQPADVLNGVRPVKKYTYDAVGRLVSVIDPQNRTTSFGYDANNRLVTTTYADATFELTTYGTGAASNRIISKRDRNGTVTTYGYDAAGRKNLTTQVLTKADGTTETVADSCTYVPGTELEASVTRRGETTVYGYDFRNRRISQSVYVNKATARTTKYTYDAADRRITETDPDGRTTYIVYDLVDHVIRTVREAVAGAVTAPANVATLARDLSANAGYVIEETAYDAEGQVVATTDGRGNVTAMAYDALGRLSSRTEAAGSPIAATTIYNYDAAGNQTAIDAPLSASTTVRTLMTYTGRNLLATSTEASGLAESGTTSFTYFADGKVATTTDPLNRVISNTYSPCCARLTQVQDALGFLTSFTYDGVGNLLTTTDPNGNIVRATYDGARRPLKRIDALGKVWTYTYDDCLVDGVGLDAAGAYGPLLADLSFGFDAVTGFGADGSAIAVKDPNGNQVVTIYDGAGRTVRTFDALNKATTIAYDLPVTDTVGGVSVALTAVRSTDALNAQTQQWSDGLGRVRVTVDALGKRARAAYDAAGNRVTFTDADNIGHTCSFDQRNRQVTCSNAGSGAVSYGYDYQNRVTTVVDALSKTESTAYDARGRKTWLTDRIGAVTRFTYDKLGNLLTITDAENGVTTYTYDARNLLATETFPGATGGTRVYTYDPGRRLSTRRDQTNALTTYVYDKAGHLTSRTYPDAKNDIFTYDSGGRLTTATSARYGTTINRTYDKANRVLTDKLTLGGESWTVTGSYDVVGQLTKLTLPDGTTEDRAYSLRRELTVAKLAGTVVASRTATDGGRLSATTYGNTRIETRAYNPADGLVSSITTPGVTSFSYTYDALKRKTAEIDRKRSAA
jgi:YD repeat-containing protein